jgi:hypothetical protein
MSETKYHTQTEPQAKLNLMCILRVIFTFFDSRREDKTSGLNGSKPRIQSPLNFLLNPFWFVTVVRKYLKGATFSKHLLAIFMSWFCPHPALLLLRWQPLLHSFITIYKSLISLLLLFVASSLLVILSFRYYCFVFLKCLLASRLILYTLSTFISFWSCNHCSLACFLWSNNFERPSLNHVLCFFNSQ